MGPRSYGKYGHDPVARPWPRLLTSSLPSNWHLHRQSGIYILEREISLKIQGRWVSEVHWVRNGEIIELVFNLRKFYPKCEHPKERKAGNQQIFPHPVVAHRSRQQGKEVWIQFLPFLLFPIIWLATCCTTTSAHFIFCKIKIKQQILILFHKVI